MNWRFLVLSSMPFLALGASVKSPKPERVAIIFNGDDLNNDSPLGQTFKKNEADGIALYRAAGFDRVIVLSKSQGETKRATAQNMMREISSLSNISELKIHFIGHGQGTGVSTNQGLYGTVISPDDPEETRRMMEEAKRRYEESQRRYPPNPTHTQ